MSKISSPKHIIMDLGKGVQSFLYPCVPGAVSYVVHGEPKSILLGAWNKWPFRLIFLLPEDAYF